MKNEAMKFLPLLVLVFIAVACASISRKFSPPTPTPMPTVANTPEIKPQNDTISTDTPSINAPNNQMDSEAAVGGALKDKVTYLPKPLYPPAAKAVRASGAVVVKVTVDEEGRVVSAEATSGHPLLRAAAVSAARQAQFKPTIVSGRAVQTEGTITYNFKP